MQEAIGQLEWRALDTGQLHEPITVDVNEAGTIATVAIPVDGKGTDAASEAALATLRDDSSQARSARSRALRSASPG